MFNNLGALSKDDMKGGDFSPLKNGLYVFTVDSAEVGETERKEWKNGVATPTGEMMPQVTVVLKVSKPDGSNTVTLADGTEVTSKSYRVWVNESNLGWNKKDNIPKEGRAVVTASLGIEPAGDISLFGNDPTVVVGAQFQAYVSTKKKKDGTDKNVLQDCEPIKKK